jgi:formate hydrogenlyase subunit 3/multisubunit Na+/H+ antiporter MnhD subunit
VPFTLFVGLLVGMPALAALVLLALGLARRAVAPAALALVAVGALVPALALLVAQPYVASGDPLRTVLLGGGSGPTDWFAPAVRLDGFGMYAGLGLTFLVVPLLLWVAWQTTPALAGTPAVPAEDAAAPDGAADPQEADSGDEPAPTGRMRGTLPAIRWASLALVLGIEAVALGVLLADSLVWVALAWVVLAVLVWVLGELGTEVTTLDRVGLALMLAGPALWLLAMLLGAVPARAATLYDLTGRGGYSPAQVVFLALTLALAGGGYPFLVWVRRRAALVTPAGFAALTVALLPIVMAVSARSYSAAQDAASHWPQIGQASPPLTAGIAFAILGALTVGVAGLVALGRRDVRGLVALLAVAQIGWALLALGVGDPVAAAGLVVLLATSVFGLGAVFGGVVLGATLADDFEPEAAGAHPFGAAPRPAALVAWSVGSATLIGVPLSGGFVARHLVSASALHVGNLIVPLVGLAWAGDGLLALALLRATAPAFVRVLGRSKADRLAAPDEAVDGESSPDDDVSDDEPVRERPRTRTGGRDIREVPGLLFAALALIAGVAPQLVLSGGGALAASALVQAHALDTRLTLTPFGYDAGTGTWLPSLAWIAVVLLALLLAFVLPAGERARQAVVLDGQAAADVSDAGAPAELAGLAEPGDAWQTLKPALRSNVAQPGVRWLLTVDGSAEEEPEADALEDAGSDEDTEAGAAASAHDGADLAEDGGEQTGGRA